jgi:hypothetical protein
VRQGLEIEDSGDQDELPKGRNIIGNPENLVHEYLFSGRDGSERARDTQSAQILGQLVQQVLQIPDMAKTLGKERIFSIFNEIFRMSGVGHDLNLQVDEADDNEDMELGQTQFIDELQKKWPQVEQALQKIIMQMQGAGGAPQPGQPPPPGGPPGQPAPSPEGQQPAMAQ